MARITIYKVTGNEPKQKLFETYEVSETSNENFALTRYLYLSEKAREVCQPDLKDMLEEESDWVFEKPT